MEEHYVQARHGFFQKGQRLAYGPVCAGGVGAFHHYVGLSAIVFHEAGGGAFHGAAHADDAGKAIVGRVTEQGAGTGHIADGEAVVAQCGGGRGDDLVRVRVLH